ncbi:uncharacterized protein PV09_06309 [Verruconis gallopava]|uniref:Peptidase S54 rhomboid domain-containing protein n=1 Tax=Verruconis gallopava TaxID=253628 RepID=A0A0D2A7K9_9PEZI|nr:uncharacterized protein PV09_06309 [Verruconis gallopava]KIW02510.1 hypothetical protein PV09_06309 [Verruconis gallopava]
MLTSGFKYTPVSQILVFWVVAASIAASISDTKHYFYLQAVPHIWKWRQFWRLLTWQTCYTNSTEVLFAAITFYNLRIIERLWGSRKFASFVLVILPYTLLLPPLILLFILRPLSFGSVNYLPAGPTPLIFAILAQFHSAIPATYRYRVGMTANPQPTLSSASSQLNSILNGTITLSSKTTSYFIPVQLALSQFPSSLLPAAVGWAIGYAYRNEAIPGTAWRLPAWIVGQRSKGPNMEALRRRLEGEDAAEGHATSRQAGSDTDEGLRGRFSRLFGEQFVGGRAQ